MAIYQFLTFIIPQKTIEQKFNRIPKRIKFNTENDERTIRWWNGIKININELEKELDQIITRKSWGDKADLVWKSEKEDFDHDVTIDYNENTRFIEEFLFRADLTDSSLTFLNSMLQICQKSGWLLMDFNGNLSKPNLKDLVRLIKSSDAYRFLKDPIDFLESIHSKNRKND
jgi:hypothetical protein